MGLPIALRYAAAIACLALLTFATSPAHAIGQPQYVEFAPSPNDFPLEKNGLCAPIHVDAADWPGVIRAAGDLRQDIARVTGHAPTLQQNATPAAGMPVLIGTLGRSATIDNLAAKGVLNVAAIKGQWECYIIQVVKRPIPGVPQALVIAGSDKRGAIYGIYDVSEEIGVSPWYWWADVPAKRHAALYVKPIRYVQGTPAVKYRGIFINDEAPSMSGWTTEKFGGFNHLMYAHMFELLLRLKANYLWPAMWGHKFDVDDPLNPKLADEYGIVMGTSHQEPMMRSDQEIEDDIKSRGPYDYAKNQAAIDQFWKGGVERVKNYENIYTLGMRGTGDTAINAQPEQIIPLLERIMRNQRQILKDGVNPDLGQVPQLFCPYKEVQGYYDQGLKVPDDVTMLWSDDNFGNLRRVPTPAEQKRSGGAGIYYHFDYVGDPRDYKWVCTVPITKIWQQMNLALDYKANRIWIVNVGDLKPMEFGIQFFMDYAFNPHRWNQCDLGDYTQMWAAQQFGHRYAPQIARVMSDYLKYNGMRKPEEMDSEPYSLTNYHEADCFVAQWQRVADQADALAAKLPEADQAAYYELVQYPAVASAGVAKLYVAAAQYKLYVAQRRADDANNASVRVARLFAADATLSKRYNGLLNSRWDHMMDQTHIGYTNWQEPPHNAMPYVPAVAVPPAAALGVSVEDSNGVWPDPSQPAATTPQPNLPVFDPLNNQTENITIFDRGAAPLRYTVASVPWVKLSRMAGTVTSSVSIQVSIDWKKVPDDFAHVVSAVVKITSPDTPAPISVGVITNAEPLPPGAKTGTFIEKQATISMEAAHYTRKTGDPDAGVSWQKIPDYGRTLSSMTPMPQNAASYTSTQGAPCLQYDVLINSSVSAWPVAPLTMNENVPVTVIAAPSLDAVPGRGIRYAIAFDDQKPQIVDLLAGDSHELWQKSVIDNCRISTTPLVSPGEGYHTLKIWMVDPGLALQKIVVNCGGVKDSYLGPPESYRTAGRVMRHDRQ